MRHEGECLGLLLAHQIVQLQAQHHRLGGWLFIRVTLSTARCMIWQETVVPPGSGGRMNTSCARRNKQTLSAGNHTCTKTEDGTPQKLALRVVIAITFMSQPKLNMLSMHASSSSPAHSSETAGDESVGSDGSTSATLTR